MLRYVIRRLLQMIPTVFGVIVITFVLFHVVGGSPGAIALGKNAAPRSLDDFDEQRGFNKPLLAGRWSPTRAFEPTSFARHAGPWRGSDGVGHRPARRGAPGHAVLEPGRDLAIPLACPLRPRMVYRWVLRYRLPAGSAILRVVRRTDAAAAPDAESAGIERQTAVLAAGPGWQTARLRFDTGGDPAALRAALHAADGPLDIAALSLQRRNAHWLDSQFVFYLGRLARLDLGVSSFTSQRVGQMLREGLGPSLCLTVPILFGSLLAAVSIALLCAYLRDTWLDRAVVVLTVALMSVNYLVWIVAGQYVFAYRLGWFPLWGFESWSYLVLPVLIGIFSGLGENVRFYRTVMLDEMYRDYVRTARAKGVGPAGLLFRHVLKNAMIPILTNVVIALPFLYTGSLLLESFFGIPGLGNLGINAINYADVDVIRALVLIGSVLYVAANLATDLCYALVDPRVRLK